MIKNFLVSHAFDLVLVLMIFILIFTGIKIRRPLVKHIFFNLAAIFIALLIYEIYLDRTSGKQGWGYNTGSYTSGYFQPSELLGYGPKDSGVITSKKFDGSNTLLYDVTYTIHNGRRLTPNSNDETPDHAVFFGCSFTFGEGLDDTSTLPFYFNEYAGRKYKVSNYGFHGYGPHQMLAIAENKLEKDLGMYNEKNTVAFYGFMPGHIARAAGKAQWDRHGPRYEIDSNRLIRTGRFNDTKNGWLTTYLDKIWNSSSIFKTHFQYRVSDHDLLRTLEIIKQTKKILEEKKIKFYVILWDHNSDMDRMVTELKKGQVQFVLVSDMMSDIKAHTNKYFLKNDDHPLASTNRIIAAYLHRQINK